MPSGPRPNRESGFAAQFGTREHPVKQNHISKVLSILGFSLSVLVVSYVMSSVHVEGFELAVAVAVVYGLLKFFLYKVLVILFLPFVILSLGLFLVVINAGLLWTTERLIDGFAIDGLFNTLTASVFISILDVLFRWVLPFVWRKIINNGRERIGPDGGIR